MKGRPRGRPFRIVFFIGLPSGAARRRASGAGRRRRARAGAAALAFDSVSHLPVLPWSTIGTGASAYVLFRPTGMGCVLAGDARDARQARPFKATPHMRTGRDK